MRLLRIGFYQAVEVITRKTPDVVSNIPIVRTRRIWTHDYEDRPGPQTYLGAERSVEVSPNSFVEVASELHLYQECTAICWIDDEKIRRQMQLFGEAQRKFSPHETRLDFTNSFLDAEPQDSIAGVF